MRIYEFRALSGRTAPDIEAAERTLKDDLAKSVDVLSAHSNAYC